jgi:hypothetical protein
MCLPINLLIYFEYFESIDPTKADDDNCPAGLRRLAARRAGRPADSEKIRVKKVSCLRIFQLIKIQI